jgi:hypothetical protein
VITLRREETGVLVMELSEHLWPDNIELTIPVLHDVARSRQNPLLLLVVVDGDFDTPLWDLLYQILQPGIPAESRLSRLAVLTTNPAEPTNNLDSQVEFRVFGSDQEYEARAWLWQRKTRHWSSNDQWRDKSRRLYAWTPKSLRLNPATGRPGHPDDRRLHAESRVGP